MTTSRRSLTRTLALAPAALGVLGPSTLLGQADDPFAGETPPNVFYSPCGRPYRAKAGAPYPVVDWFKQADANGDDKVDRAEFRADADRFFKKLDLNGDGALSRYEITVYEHKWVPEILGGTVGVGFNDAAPRLWLAQYSGGPGPGGALGGVNASINPQGDKPMATPKAPEGLNETGVGASPYSFFDEPEPIMTADLNVNGLILRDNFLKVADMHFDSLDPDGRGYLTLKTLPQTTVEKLLNQSHHRKSSR